MLSCANVYGPILHPCDVATPELEAFQSVVCEACPALIFAHVSTVFDPTFTSPPVPVTETPDTIAFAPCTALMPTPPLPLPLTVNPENTAPSSRLIASLAHPLMSTCDTLSTGIASALNPIPGEPLIRQCWMMLKK